MCQYYRWQCTHCPAENDVVVRCKTNHQRQQRDPCARTSTLPLPLDAPQLECQHCTASSAAAVNLDTRFRRLSIQQLTTPAPSPEHQHSFGGGGIQHPSDYDIFWLNPALRLPDAAGKICEYVDKRKKVFRVADESMKVQRSSDGKEKEKQEEGKGAGWRNSWSQLQEALEKI